MNQTILIIQSIVALILIVLILLQEKGTALGSAFGGSGESYSTKRGLQKTSIGPVLSLQLFLLLWLSTI